MQFPRGTHLPCLRSSSLIWLEWSRVLHPLSLLMPAIINNNQRDPSDKNAPVSYDPVTEIEACRASRRRRKRRRREGSLRDSSNEIRRSRSEAVSGHDSIPADSFNLLFIVLLFSIQRWDLPSDRMKSTKSP